MTDLETLDPDPTLVITTTTVGPDGTTQCASRVIPPGSYPLQFPCRIPATYLERGETWCRVHAPSMIAARQERERRRREAAQASEAAIIQACSQIVRHRDALAQCALDWVAADFDETSTAAMQAAATTLHDAEAARDRISLRRLSPRREAQS